MAIGFNIDDIGVTLSGELTQMWAVSIQRVFHDQKIVIRLVSPVATPLDILKKKREETYLKVD